MLSRSAAYRSAIAAGGRIIDARVQLIVQGDPLRGGEPTVTVSAPQARISHPSHLANGRTSAPVRYAVLGQVRCDDPTWGLAPTDGAQEMGIWTAPTYVAGAGGVLSPPLTVTVSYPQSVTAFGLTVAGDAPWGQGPVDWQATLRLGGSTVHTVTVTGATVPVHQVVISPPVEMDELELVITRWSHAGEVIRLTEASPAPTHEWGRGDIVAIDALHEAESELGRASADELRVRLLARAVPSELVPLLIRPGRQLVAEVGLVGAERQPLGAMWVRDVALRAADAVVEVVARDLIELLEDLRWDGLPPTSGLTLRDAIEAVFNTAGVPSTLWSVDPALDDIALPWCALPAGTVRQAVERLALIGDATVTTNRMGRLIVRQRSTPTTWETITDARIVERERPLAMDQLRTAVRVVGAQLALGASGQVAQSTITVPAGLSTWEITWGEPASGVTVTVSGAASLDAVLETQATRVVVRLSSTSGGQATVTVSGQRLEAGGAVVGAADATLSASYGRRELVVEEPLVQTQAHADWLAGRMLGRYALLQPLVTIRWRGDPALEVGDGIEVAGARYVVERIETEVAGGLAQRVTARWVEDVP